MMTPARKLRLVAGKFTPLDLRAYWRTDHWRNKREIAELFWRDFFGLGDVEPLPCICGCGREAEQMHHTSIGYKNLFAEDVKLHLRPMAEVCHRKLHRGRKR